MASIQKRIEQLLQALGQDMFEKEKPIRLALLSAIAGESIFLLGPPGVAKSMIARRLKFAFKGARAFEYLMGKFSTPDEVFGPVSISKLKHEDKYERLTHHYLPGAQIVFLDEIWKASPPIQNALLTVLNEKIYRNGEQEIKVDIRGLIAASNELPLRGEGLEALWDRFLIRLMVRPIQDEQKFNQMVVLPRHSGYGDPIKASLKINDEEYHQWMQQVDTVQVPPHVLGVIAHIRKRIRERNATAEEGEEMYVSDRRWRKIVRLMRASALLNGRDEVDVMDCFLIADCIWNLDSQIAEARQLVQQSVQDFGYRKLVNIPALLDELERLQDEIEEQTRFIQKKRIRQLKNYLDKNQKTFYKIEQFWGNDPAFIRSSDYEKLQAEGQEVFIPIFEKAGNHFQPFKTYAIKLLDDYTVVSKNKELPIETEEVEKEVVLRQPAPAQILHAWQREIDQLLHICDESMQELQRRKEVDQSHLSTHLFVDASCTQFVSKSLEQAATELLNIRLEIEKTRHSYESIEATGA